MRTVVRERPKRSQVRLFVALDIPEAIRAEIARWQDTTLGDDPALRPVRPEALHMTLAFLGYLPESEIEPAATVVRRIESRAVRIRLRPDPVPVPRGRPRLFVIDAESNGAVRLHEELSTQLQAAHLYTPEKRPFWPHLTIARVRSEAPGRRGPARVQHPPRALPAALEQPFGSVRITLYLSNLRPQEAEYVSLVNVELPPDSG